MDQLLTGIWTDNLLIKHLRPGTQSGARLSVTELTWIDQTLLPPSLSHFSFLNPNRFPGHTNATAALTRPNLVTDTCPNLSVRPRTRLLMNRPHTSHISHRGAWLLFAGFAGTSTETSAADTRAEIRGWRDEPYNLCSERGSLSRHVNLMSVELKALSANRETGRYYLALKCHILHDRAENWYTLPGQQRLKRSISRWKFLPSFLV